MGHYFLDIQYSCPSTLISSDYKSIKSILTNWNFCYDPSSAQMPQNILFDIDKNDKRVLLTCQLLNNYTNISSKNNNWKISLFIKCHQELTDTLMILHNFNFLIFLLSALFKKTTLSFIIFSSIHVLNGKLQFIQDRG